MDPLTAIGAVASIVQLAQTALSLSKTLYSLGAAVASASDDIQVLADDLKTFSQSLTLLSRLLEDSKAWYSDDIYLLTAKVIKDCAELYVKIDKILEKLGGNGKSTWKLRVKFVYKEGQIRKLMKRLRDMKGTLATILMSLQVDLQLSLLNISSASKIQRSQDIGLQPETVQVLQNAQKAVANGGFLPKYTAISPQITTNLPEKVFSSSSTHIKTTQTPHIVQSASRFEMADDFNAQFQRAINQRPIDTINVSQCFVAMPSQLHQLEATGSKRVLPRSVRSSSSTESFKSAISVQEEELELARKIKAVQSVMHAFTTSLEALQNFIERRIRDRRSEVYAAAKSLQECLVNGGQDFDQKHVSNFKQHGQTYIQFLNTNNNFSTFQSLSSRLSYQVVLGLHELSPEYLDVHPSQLNVLTDRTQHNCALILQSLVTCATDSQQQPEVTMSPIALPASPNLHNKIDENVTQQNTETVDSAPELSLPFIGYTFKRFSQRPGNDTVRQSHPKKPELPPIMDDPVSHTHVDADDYTQPAHMEAEAVQNSHFKVDIRNEPIVEQDADAQAALDYVANTLRSTQVPVSGRKPGTGRGRRDVLNTFYQPLSSPPENEPPQEYQKQLLFNEHVQLPANMPEQERLEQYTLHYCVIGQYDKQRLMEAPQAQDSQPESQALRDYRLQLRLVEQKNKQRLMEARQAQDSQPESQALQDYKTQLQGISVPNMKLMGNGIEKQENMPSTNHPKMDVSHGTGYHQSSEPSQGSFGQILAGIKSQTTPISNEHVQPPSSMSEEERLEQYEIQLRFLEQNNKQRLMYAWQSQHNQDQAPQYPKYHYRRDVQEERGRSHSPVHKKHLAEGALSGAGVAEPLADHRDKVRHELQYRGRNIVSGAALGALGSEIQTRARSRYREREEHSRSRSRSISRSRSSHEKVKTRLGLAAAAATQHVENRKVNREELGRGRSRTRSTSRRRRRSLRRSTSISDDLPTRIVHVDSTISPSMNTALQPPPGPNKYIPPKTEEEKAAHSKALQDYQMSLMMLDCRQNKNRRQMVRTDEQSQGNIAQNNEAQVAQDDSIFRKHYKPAEVAKVSEDGSLKLNSQYPQYTEMFNFSNPPATSTDQFQAVNTDILQYFDFDSFLSQDSQDSGAFDFGNLSSDFSSGNSYDALEAQLPTNQTQASQHQLYEEVNEPPLFVNPKQFYRICKRRTERQELEERLRSKRPTRVPYLHESRHGQGRRRPRGPDGRFLTADEIAALEQEKKGDVVMKEDDTQMHNDETSSSITHFTSPHGTELADSSISPESTGYKLFMPTQPSQPVNSKPFMHSSSFGQSLGELPIRQNRPSVTDDLLGDNEPENSNAPAAYPPKSTTSPASDFDKPFHESLSDRTQNLPLEPAKALTKPVGMKTFINCRRIINGRGSKKARGLVGVAITGIKREEQGDMTNPQPCADTDQRPLSHSNHEDTPTSIPAPSPDRTQDPVLLAPSQSSRLWWQAYTALASQPSLDLESHPSIYAMISETLQANFTIGSLTDSDHSICIQITQKVETLRVRIAREMNEARDEGKEIYGIKCDILRIIETIQQQLGLEIATLGWSCCISLLSMLQNSQSKDLALYKHLLQITSLIARYSVMENLYLSSPTLTLNPEYRIKLLNLCTTMLKFFALSFNSFQSAPGGETAQKIEAVIREIELLDEGCRGFRVLCSADEGDADGSGDEEMGGVEDVTETDESGSESDASWEAIEREESWA